MATDGNKDILLERRILGNGAPCQSKDEIKQLWTEIKFIQEKMATFQVLTHRVNSIETILAEFKKDFETTMTDIHAIQISITETNLLRTWVGHVVIAVLAAGLTLVVTRYGSAV